MEENGKNDSYKGDKTSCDEVSCLPSSSSLTVLQEKKNTQSRVQMDTFDA